MNSLSIATKMWAPIIVLALAAGTMTSISALRASRLSEEAKLSQSSQQRKFSLALRWRGMTEPKSGSYPAAGSPGGGLGGPMMGAIRWLM